jgi:hypothetical protein
VSLPEQVTAILRATGVTRAIPQLVAGDLSVERTALQESDAWAALALGEQVEGWVCHTGSWSRYPCDKTQGTGPLLHAEAYDPDSKTSVRVRYCGEAYEVMTLKPVEGAGLRMVRRYRSVDGGRLHYETWWAPDESPVEGAPGSLAPRIVRFVGFEDRS